VWSMVVGRLNISPLQNLLSKAPLVLLQI
jgi:hypothetical protein